jgi:hypothetical protein
VWIEPVIAQLMMILFAMVGFLLRREWCAACGEIGQMAGQSAR